MNANNFGLTQYWPTLCPKTRRKRKRFPQTKANSESKGVESSELRVPIEDNPRHTSAVESLPLNLETPIVLDLYEDTHTVSSNTREKLKIIDKGKVKFDSKSN